MPKPPASQFPSNDQDHHRLRAQSSQDFTNQMRSPLSPVSAQLARDRAASASGDLGLRVESPSTPHRGRRVRLPSINSPRFQSQPDAPTATELAKRLALLLHARDCRKTACGLRNCDVARGVLDHCQECSLEYGACHASCSQAKTLLRHFRVCRARSNHRACPICAVVRRDYAWSLNPTQSSPRTATGPLALPRLASLSSSPKPQSEPQTPITHTSDCIKTPHSTSCSSSSPIAMAFPS